jgi:hypothetical protein
MSVPPTWFVSDVMAIAIENNSQVVFDALAIAVAPDLVLTIFYITKRLRNNGSMAKDEGRFVAYVSSRTPKCSCWTKIITRMDTRHWKVSVWLMSATGLAIRQL